MSEDFLKCCVMADHDLESIPRGRSVFETRTTGRNVESTRTGSLSKTAVYNRRLAQSLAARSSGRHQRPCQSVPSERHNTPIDEFAWT